MILVTLKFLIMLGLKKGALKLALLATISGTLLGGFFGQVPEVIFGITLFLWILYVATITLDWFTGISAGRFEAKKEGRVFSFNKDLANNNWYKHALFIIIISAIYHLQKECIRLELSSLLSRALVGIKLGYFTYNMATEWVSIENNRFRVNGKYSRFGNLLKGILEVLDKAALKKVRKITDSDDN